MADKILFFQLLILLHILQNIEPLKLTPRLSLAPSGLTPSVNKCGTFVKGLIKTTQITFSKQRRVATFERWWD